MLILTIDTGTTNTRVRLWRSKHYIDMEAAAVGVKDTGSNGDTSLLRETLRKAIANLIERHGLSPSDIGLVIAAGMITSNIGLLEVPHVNTPVSVEKLANHITSKVFPDIFHLPIHFIPGVKNSVNDDASGWEVMDMMRGEEVEIFATLRLLPKQKHAALVLPGSHTKFAFINEQDHIEGCSTTLTGELTAAITHNTILSGSLQSKFTDSLDIRSLFEGASSLQSQGLTKTLFSLRILDVFYGKSHEELASFLLGAIVASDIQALLSSPFFNQASPPAIYIVGGSPVAVALSMLISKQCPELDVQQLQSSELPHLSGIGCIEVAKQGGLI